jgi:hypothetical protein
MSRGKFNPGRGVSGTARSERTRTVKAGRSGRPAKTNKNLQIAGNKKKKKDQYK